MRGWPKTVTVCVWLCAWRCFARVFLLAAAVARVRRGRDFAQLVSFSHQPSHWCCGTRFQPQSMMIAKNGQMRKVEGEKLEVLYDGNWARCRWVEPTKGLHGSSVVAYHRLLRPIGCCRFELIFWLRAYFLTASVVGGASYWEGFSVSKLFSSKYVFDKKLKENSKIFHNVRRQNNVVHRDKK